MSAKIKSSKVFSYERDSVDKDGVLHKSIIERKSVHSVDAFYRVFIEHVALTNRLPYAELKLLRAIASYVQWDTNYIVFGAHVNGKICIDANIKENTRRVCVHRLTQKNFLIKNAVNWYTLNPNIFFKGSDVERARSIRLSYQWDMDLTVTDPGSTLEPNEEFED